MKIDKILVIIQRSNGDVFFSKSLIEQLREKYEPSEIDLLVNLDTLSIAKTFTNINKVITFSYQKKSNNRWRQEKEIIKKIFMKYDLSINLTSSDRSVLYAILSSKRSISATEKDFNKSWWKRLFLNQSYFFDKSKHILLNNLTPLDLLGIKPKKYINEPEIEVEIINSVKKRLRDLNISKFMIFHASAQYTYKIYPKHLRDKLLSLLSESEVTIILTGGESQIDQEIKKSLLNNKKIFDWIGTTSIKEYMALSQLSSGYIGMDTLNMHIAASQNKRVFAVFGPTKLDMWSPWENHLGFSTMSNSPLQTYGNITIFQADMKCVACGFKGCENTGYSKCLDNINPNVIHDAVLDWYKNA